MANHANTCICFINKPINRYNRMSLTYVGGDYLLYVFFKQANHLLSLFQYLQQYNYYLIRCSSFESQNVKMDIKRQRRPGKNKFDNFLVTAHPELDIKGTYQNINGQKSLQNVVLIYFYGEIKKEIIIQNVYYNAKITFN